MHAKPDLRVELEPNGHFFRLFWLGDHRRNVGNPEMTKPLKKRGRHLELPILGDTVAELRIASDRSVTLIFRSKSDHETTLELKIRSSYHVGPRRKHSRARSLALHLRRRHFNHSWN